MWESVGWWILATVMGEYDPTDLLEQEARADEQRSADQLAQRKEDEDFVWLMRGQKGRRFIYRMLTETGVFGPSFSTNAMQMAQNEGRRSVGCELLQRIEALCPEAYENLMMENRK